MSSLTFINRVQEFPAQFDITQNGELNGIVSADIGGKVSVPTSNSYTVYAVINLDDNTYTTGIRTFEAQSQNILAQCKQRDGTISFELVLGPGTQPNMITLRNTTRTDVQFFVRKNDTPLETVMVCGPYIQESIDTTDNYSIKAVVNGITTEDVGTSDPNATFETISNNVEGPKGPSASLRIVQGGSLAA